MRSLVTSLAVLLLFANDISAQRRGAEIQSGPWAKSKTPSGWVLLRTRNFLIQSQCGRERAKRLGKHMEAMNKLFRRLFGGGKDGGKRQVIKLFRTRANYLQYGAPPGSAAHYSHGEREMTCFAPDQCDDNTRQRLTDVGGLVTTDLLGCSAREAFYQYLLRDTAAPKQPLPTWLHEGMGDYFFAAAPTDEHGTLRANQPGRVHKARLSAMKAARCDGQDLEVADLLELSKHGFQANAAVCQAESWALCQFLLHAGSKRHAAIIPHAVQLARYGMDDATIRQRAFGGIDLGALDTEFKAWLDSLPIPDGGQLDEDIRGEN